MSDIGQEVAAVSDGEPVSAIQRLIDLVGGVTAAARIAQVARNTADQWFKGRSRIPFSAVVRLADEAGVGIDGLLGRTETASMIQVQRLPNADNLPPGFVAVPMLSLRASAGPGLVALEETARQDVLSFREDWMRRIGLTPGKAEALFVSGDSMEPTIRDGDMILIDRQIDRVIDGGLYVLVIGGDVRVKRILMRTNGDLVLKSDNPIWTDELVPANDAAELIIEGRVRWFGRAI